MWTASDRDARYSVRGLLMNSFRHTGTPHAKNCTCVATVERNGQRVCRSLHRLTQYSSARRDDAARSTVLCTPAGKGEKVLQAEELTLLLPIVHDAFKVANFIPLMQREALLAMLVHLALVDLFLDGVGGDKAVHLHVPPDEMSSRRT